MLGNFRGFGRRPPDNAASQLQPALQILTPAL